jgi:hypothetical protein
MAVKPPIKSEVKYAFVPDEFHAEQFLNHDHGQTTLPYDAFLKANVTGAAYIRINNEECLLTDKCWVLTRQADGQKFVIEDRFYQEFFTEGM